MADEHELSKIYIEDDEGGQHWFDDAITRTVGTRVVVERLLPDNGGWPNRRNKQPELLAVFEMNAIRRLTRSAPTSEM